MTIFNLWVSKLIYTHYIFRFAYMMPLEGTVMERNLFDRQKA